MSDGFPMPLTAFGLTCRRHRTRMNAVMADQSLAMGISSTVISGIERGLIALPENYVSRLVVWMQLTESEASELQACADLPAPPVRRPVKKKPDFGRDGELIKILDEMAIRKASIK